MTDLRQGITPIQHEVFDELDRALAKFPTWPTDPLHALAVLGEEIGELNIDFGKLTKATLQAVYEPHKSSMADVRCEAIQTAAMALRFLASLDRYELITSDQHQQGEPAPERDQEPHLVAVIAHAHPNGIGMEHTAVLRAGGIPTDNAEYPGEHSAIMREILGH